VAFFPQFLSRPLHRFSVKKATSVPTGMRVSDLVRLDDPDSLCVTTDDISHASVSLLFDLPLANYRRWTSIPSGVSVLSLSSPLFHSVPPIEASLFENRDAPEIPGHLSLSENFLRFDPAALARSPIIIPLLGNLEAGLLPHPCDDTEGADLHNPNSPCLLVVTYLKDVADEKSMTIVYFSGKQCDISLYRQRIRDGAQNAQTIANYVAPNPNDIRLIEAKPVMHRRLSFSSSGPILPGPRRMRTTHASEIEIVGQSRIVERKEVIQIQGNVPARFHNSVWRLLFQLSIHGCSYSTMYEQTEKQEPLILLLRTDGNDRIGAFLPSGLKRSPRYYGTGETFVFHFTPRLEVFRWTRGPDSNEFFISSSAEDLTMGGGGGAAIWIDNTMNNGRSDDCKTFGSPRLTHNPAFKVIDMEVWKIGRTRTRV
jgi:hypothetical protein